MIHTKGKSEDFRGSAPSVSPTAQAEGVFSLCRGGVPFRGAFARSPGKTISDLGTEKGGAISIYQFSDKIVVQRFIGIEIFNIETLLPI